MAAVLGSGRSASIARELTKAFENVRSGTLAGLAEQYAAEAAPKGEIVVLVGPPEERATDRADADRLLASLLESKPLSEAVTEAASLTGLKRRDLYRRALAMKDRDAT
jgi:16S rRNA (cytidine1402-2'-O)-methyltransferase